MKYSVILFLMVIISNSFGVNEPKSPIPTDTKFSDTKFLRRSQEQAIIGAKKRNDSGEGKFFLYFDTPCGSGSINGSPILTYVPNQSFLPNKDLQNTHPFSNEQNSQNSEKTYYP